MGLVEQVYSAAANAGLTVRCRWFPAGGGAVQTRQVGFTAPDDTALDGLTLNTDYAITYPASVFVGLAVRDTVNVNGVSYQVRDVRALGDGTEMRARLTRL